MLKKKIMVALAAVYLAGCAATETHPQVATTEHHAEATEAHAEHHAHWAYEGENGPANWDKVDPKFVTCSAGKNQSPINLTDFTKAALQPIKFDYQVGGDEIVNNGHTIQVNFAAGSAIELNGVRYALKQFHAHAPSENQINGKSFPMEFHFVHADAAGNLAVVGVMVEEGAENLGLDKAWKAIPEQVDEKLTLQENVFDAELMPKDKAYYRFNGSLTTPPCSEGVTWLVLKQPISASKEQIEHFAHVMHHHNNRPIQPLNARLIVE